jgi:restriction system protein
VAQRRYDHERWARQQAREEQRQERADLAAQKAVERERKQEAIEAGRAQAEQHNRSNADKLLRLTSILHRGLDRRAAIDLTRLRRHDRPPPLNLGERGEPKREPEWQDYAPAEPGALSLDPQNSGAGDLGLN